MNLRHHLLLAACAAIVVVAAAMAIQEVSHAEEARASEEAFGVAPVMDVAFRDAWRLPVLLLVLAVGVLGSALVAATMRRKRLRAVSGRLIALLIGGMTWLDVVYLVDLRLLFLLDHEVRALAVIVAYPLGGILVAGSVYRLAELEPVFGSDAPDRPLLEAERKAQERLDSRE